MQAHPWLANTVDWRLYYVTDTELSGGLDRVPQIVEAAVRGGAGVVQVRDKHIDDDTFRQLTRDCMAANDRAFDATGRRAAIVVNDRLRIAEELGLHFHQGQDDGDIHDARRRLGKDLLIGLSISSDIELEAELADQTADVLGLSPIWSTPTKTDTAEPLGLTGAQHLVELTAKRAKTVAIGGINPLNARWAIETGVDGICVVSAIASSDDPESAAQTLLSLWRTR
ncbi:MAG: thiamine phosphate synthase [Propionibacteriaceae bacterium]|nr:thiamine phosphate synthase [Propionibacteriaceae bacterium]